MSSREGALRLNVRCIRESLLCLGIVGGVPHAMWWLTSVKYSRHMFPRKHPARKIFLWVG